MHVIRRVVLPIIWVAIFALIAAALVKVAFFPDTDTTGADGTDTVPAAAGDQYSVVSPEKADITNTISLTGQVVSDAGTPLQSPVAGEIYKVYAENNQSVAEGDKLVRIRIPDETADAASSGESGSSEGSGGEDATATESAPEPSYTYKTVRADRDGRITDLTALKGQEVGIGDPIATVVPASRSITATVTPAQQYQLLDKSLDAQVSLEGAPAFPCPSARIIDPEAPSASGDDKSTEENPEGESGGDGSGDESGQATFSCPVPADVKAVSGLSATIDLASGEAKGVLTLPVTAVRGDLENGTVYTLDDATGETTEVPVKLGLRDDEKVEITDGIDESSQVLQFVPGEEDPDQEEMMGW